MDNKMPSILNFSFEKEKKIPKSKLIDVKKIFVIKKNLGKDKI